MSRLLKNILIAVTIYFSSDVALAQRTGPDGNMNCYTISETKKIARAISNLEVCQTKLKLRDDLINSARFSEQYVQWWQEPQIIASGLVISFSLGAVIGILVTHG